MKSYLRLSIMGVILASNAVAQDDDFCALTAQLAQRSCKEGAESDYQLALGKCVNVSDATQRKTCEEQATTDFKDALHMCDAEFSVRRSACTRLGEGRYDPNIDPADFTDKIDNPYFPLKPGTVLIYEGTTGGARVHSEFAVTHKTVKILGVTTVEVHDTVFTDGELTEDTLDWFAQDSQGNVWYFGENTEELTGGRPSNLGGTFTAGVDGAKPGIIMEAHSVIGDFYRQEFALGEAEDFAEVKSLTDTVHVPAGKFSHCLRTHETTPLEPDLREDKWYAPGIGNVLTRDLNTGEEIKLIAIKNVD